MNNNNNKTNKKGGRGSNQSQSEERPNYTEKKKKKKKSEGGKDVLGNLYHWCFLEVLSVCLFIMAIKSMRSREGKKQ